LGADEISRVVEMGRFDMTAQQWAQVKVHATTSSGRGLTEDDRNFINAVLYIARTNMLWEHLPQRYGDSKQVQSRFSRWKQTGKWLEIFTIVSLDSRSEFCIMNDGREPEDYLNEVIR
jgi:transposase